jgi:polyisoprenoid-binding protein YceI
MKTILTLALAVTATAFTLTSAVMAPVSFKVDAAKSNITWLAKKVTGEHSGRLTFQSGTVLTDGKALTGGTFTVDMTTLIVTDITDKETNGKLVGHLNSPDFFDVAGHKTSTLAIKNVKATGKDTYDVTADLTIKGITKPVTFPATVTITGSNVTAKATVKVDRTNYDIKYGSGKFFEGLGDKVIYDDFTIDLNVVAAK